MLKALRKAATRLLNVNAYRSSFRPTLPEVWRPVFDLIYYHTLDLTAEEKALGQRIEAFRGTIASEYAGSTVRSYTSPHSNTFRKGADGHAEPGAVRDSTVAATLTVGSNIHKGILLRRIAAAGGFKRILELGTNTGFSGAYFVSLPDTHLVTVEGSDQLSQIARTNISRIGDNFEVRNTLFDEAIDALQAAGEQFDAVFIDGQHEKEATLHYAERCRPLLREGGYWLFDDIYWSDDMLAAWEELKRDLPSDLALDLFMTGLIRYAPSATSRRLHDLGEVIERPQVNRVGW